MKPPLGKAHNVEVAHDDGGGHGPVGRRNHLVHDVLLGVVGHHRLQVYVDDTDGEGGGLKHTPQHSAIYHGVDNHILDG